MNAKDISNQVNQLQTDVEWIRQLLEVQGVSGPWLTPNEAAPILGVSGDRIKDEIEAAEYARINSKKSDLIYGEHYFNAQNPHDTRIQRPSWKIHFQKFGTVIKRPTEQRTINPR